MSNNCFFNSNIFVYNSDLIQSIKDYKLNLNEFLLLIYFLNSKVKQFDIDEIKNVLNLDKKEILFSFNSLVEKKIVSLVTKKNKSGVIQEFISLDNLYNIINSSSSDADDSSEILKYLEDNLGIKHSDGNLEIIKSWLSRSFEKDYIKEIIDRAKYDSVKDIRYVDKLLYESATIEKKETTNQDLFDYDWLNEDKK